MAVNGRTRVWDSAANLNPTRVAKTTTNVDISANSDAESKAKGATMNTDKAKIAKAVNRMKLIGRTIGLGIMGYGLWISAGHITEVGHALQLTDMEAKTLFIFVDVVALFGKLLTSHYLVAKTRRIGFKLMVSGGAASLLCNVTAGLLTGGLGRALYGVVIVAIVAGIEYATLNIKGKTVDVNRTSKPQTAAPAVPAAAPAQRRKCAAGCQCGRHNRAAAPRKLRLVATP